MKRVELGILHLHAEPDHLAGKPTDVRVLLPGDGPPDRVGRYGITIHDRELRDLIIRFIEDCRFSDHRKGIHLVYDGNSGPVTVFYIPHRKIDRLQAIGKNEFQGIIFPHHEGTMAIVGLIGEDLKSQRSKVEAAFNWNRTTTSS